MLKEERGSQELFGQGDLVDESDLASEFTSRITKSNLICT
jgi:hypothetical protein